MTNEQDPESKSSFEPPAGLGPMGCQPSLEQIYKYMDGYLDEETKSEISSHLDVCGGCDDFYHFQTGLKRLLGSRCHSELPADLPMRVFRSITDLS